MLNVYGINNRVSKSIGKKLLELQGEIELTTIISETLVQLIN